MTAQVHREIEVKLEVEQGWTLPSLAPAVATTQRGRRRTLTATYYDTPDLRLARHRITLRRRTGGNDDGWHLKLPAGGEHTRDEVCLPLAAPGDPPRELVWMVFGITRGAVLSPVATLVNVRQPWLAVGADGRALAEITDDQVTVQRDGEPDARFREVEVEAAAGRALHELDAVVAALTASGARPSSFASKAARALGEAARLAADVDAGAELGAGVGADSAAGAMHRRVRQLVGDVQRRDLAVRRDLPHAVAALARAVADLRGALTAPHSPYQHDWASALARELGGVTEVIDRAGDSSEFRELLREPRYVALLDRLIDACQAPRLAGERS